jgi:hypothetical protein
MLTDRYGLALSTASAAARDAYVQASDLALTFYPGATEAYDQAIAADPGFALSHAGKAQVLMRQGDVAACRFPVRSFLSWSSTGRSRDCCKSPAPRCARPSPNWAAKAA